MPIKTNGKRIDPEMVSSAEAATLHEASRELFQAGRYRQAVSNSVAAIRAFRTRARRAESALAMNALGMALGALGRRRWAIRCYEVAEAELAAAGDREGAAMVRNNRGTLLFIVGAYRPALDLQIAALDELKAIGSEPHIIATGLRNVGAALHKLGDFIGAIARYDEALALLDGDSQKNLRLRSGLYTNRGAAKFRLPDTPAAEADYRIALSLARADIATHSRVTEAEALHHLAEVLLLRGDRPDEAAVLAREAVPIAVRAGHFDLVWRCLHIAGRTGADPASRIFFGKLAAWILREEARRAAADAAGDRTRFLDVRGYAFSDLVVDLIDAGRLAEAFSIATLSDRFGVAAALPTRWVITDAIPFDANERAARARWLEFAELTASGSADRSASAAFERWLSRPLDSPVAAAPALFFSSLHLRQPAQGRVRMQFAVGRDILRVAMTDRSGIPRTRSVPWRAADLSRAVYEFARVCRKGGAVGDAHRLGEILYRRLFETALDGVDADTTHLEIVADGPLRAMPWAALWDGEAYLVERVAPVLVCGVPRPSIAGSGAVAAFAAAREGLNAPGLPHAAREAREIAGLYGARARGIGIDAGFSSQALAAAIADGVSILHFATHFALDPVDLRRSCMRLGDGSTLDVASLVRLNLGKIDEIVLSACEAGLTPGGSDAKSLPDLLASLGVSNIVAALWPVPDATTADLMIAYHRARLVKDDPALALANAQRSVLAATAFETAGDARGIGDFGPMPDRKDPRAWAGFCVFEAIALALDGTE